VLLASTSSGGEGVGAGSAIATVSELLISPSPIEFVAEYLNLYLVPEVNWREVSVALLSTNSLESPSYEVTER
jgi:hypothetical protein